MAIACDQAGSWNGDLRSARQPDRRRRRQAGLAFSSAYLVRDPVSATWPGPGMLGVSAVAAGVALLMWARSGMFTSGLLATVPLLTAVAALVAAPFAVAQPWDIWLWVAGLLLLLPAGRILLAASGGGSWLEVTQRVAMIDLRGLFGGLWLLGLATLPRPLPP